MFSNIKLIIAGLVAAILLGGGWYINHLQDQVEERDKIIHTQRAVITGLEYSNDHLKESVVERQRLADQYYSAAKEARDEAKKTNAQLTKYRSRQEVVFAKPELVERLERKAWDDFFKEDTNE